VAVGDVHGKHPGRISARILHDAPEERLPLSAYGRPLLGTGFCGALTTFSTVQVELLKMLDVHRYGQAVGYATASIILGYASLQLATAFVRRVRTVA
jgi:fluoride exporter